MKITSLALIESSEKTTFFLKKYQQLQLYVPDNIIRHQALAKTQKHMPKTFERNCQIIHIQSVDSYFFTS